LQNKNDADKLCRTGNYWKTKREQKLL
jgi:hypothetical protein